MHVNFARTKCGGCYKSDVGHGRMVYIVAQNLEDGGGGDLIAGERGFSHGKARSY